MSKERRDNKGRLLLTGESQIRNGSYTFRYTDENGVRKCITNWKLLPEDQPPEGDTNPECLRDIEKRITNRRVKAMPKTAKTVNAFWKQYLSMKCEIAETTLIQYIYLYNKHVKNEFGKRPIQSVRYSDVKRFYISKTGNREIPMLTEVRETLMELHERRNDFNADNQIVIDGYTNFVFRDLYGGVYSNRRINRQLRKITETYNCSGRT